MTDNQKIFLLILLLGISPILSVYLYVYCLGQRSVYTRMLLVEFKIASPEQGALRPWEDVVVFFYRNGEEAPVACAGFDPETRVFWTLLDAGDYTLKVIAKADKRTLLTLDVTVPSTTDVNKKVQLILNGIIIEKREEVAENERM